MCRWNKTYSSAIVILDKLESEPFKIDSIFYIVFNYVIYSNFRDFNTYSSFPFKSSL